MDELSADDYDEMVASYSIDSEDTNSEGSCAADVAVGAVVSGGAGAASGVFAGPVATGLGAVVGTITGGVGTLITSPNCTEYQVDPERAENDYSEASGMS